MKRAFLYMLVGAVAGILLFAISEPLMPRGIASDVQMQGHNRAVGFGSGVLLCGLIGLLSGYLQGSKTHIFKGLGAGIVIGLFTGPLALSFGNRVFSMLGGENTSVLSRVPGWAFFGLILGGGVALTEAFIVRSASRTYSALLGGLAGGALGGFLFEGAAALLGQSIAQAQGSGDVGGPSRAIGFFALCGVIGLFIGVAQALSTKARLRLIYGRNEFKEWPVDSSQATIGRAENVDIPVFADPSLAPLMATIVRQSGRFIIHDAGTPMGIGVNGVRVPNAALNHGDTIQMGSLTFQFLLSGYAPAPAPQVMPRPEPQPMAHPMGQPTMQPQFPVSSATTAMPAMSNMTTAMPSPQAPAMVRLVAIAGPVAGNIFPVHGSLELGREAHGVSLAADSAASRRHARLEMGPRGLVIQDLQSKNGTFVNGTRIFQPTLLNIGDQIQVGTSQFRVE